MVEKQIVTIESQRMYITHWRGQKIWMRLLFINGIMDSPYYFVKPPG